MAKTHKVVWYDGFTRQREECELVGIQDDVYCFKDAEGVVFYVNRSQMIKIDDTIING